MAMALGVTASAYAANPFSDVPAGHWAYDSVNKLAAAGVVDGYPDGTYGGEKLMTRYEMAQIVAKAMAKGANVDKLAAEFAEELDSLGVRVANLEEKADNVKITGEIRYHYADNDGDTDGYYISDNKGVEKDRNENKLRSRIWVTGQVNDDWSYTGMIENIQNFDNESGDETTKFQRAYVNGKIGGVKLQAGRYNLQLAEGNVYDNRFDGVQVSYGDNVKVTAGYGKATPSTVNAKYAGKFVSSPTPGFEGFELRSESDEVYYAEVTGKTGKLGLGAGYYAFNNLNGYAFFEGTSGVTRHPDKDVAEDVKGWQVNASYAFDKNVKVAAMYQQADDESFGQKVDDDGFVATLSYKGAKASEPGSWGLVAKYYDQGVTTYMDHTMNGQADDMFGFKGYSVAANYTFAKNIVGQVEYYDLEEKEYTRESETIWGQLVFLF